MLTKRGDAIHPRFWLNNNAGRRSHVCIWSFNSGYITRVARVELTLLEHLVPPHYYQTVCFILGRFTLLFVYS